MAQAVAGNRRSMFDSDSDDSNDGNTLGNITTAQDLVATERTIVDASTHNAGEDLSPSKKIKLMTEVVSPTKARGDMVKSKDDDQELKSTDTEVLLASNPRRSARTRQTNKSTNLTSLVQKSKVPTKVKVRNSKEVVKIVVPPNKSDDNQTTMPMTKAKCKTRGKKQPRVNSSLVSASISSNAVLSTASNIDELSNSDSEDSRYNVAAQPPQPPFCTSFTKSTRTSITTSVRDEAVNSNRVTPNPNTASGAILSSSADVTKKYYSAQATDNAGSSKTSKATPIHIAGKQNAPGAQTITSNDSIKPSERESCMGASASVNTSGNKEDTSEDAPIVLTAAQRARMEQNRQRALLIRQERMNKVMPPLKKSEQLEKEGKKVLCINDTKLVDTGAGFFLEEDDGFDSIPEADIIAALRRAEEPAPLIPEDRPRCADCGNIFDSSYLFKHFDHPVCDDCRDNECRHALITKTDARNEYQLQDVDLEKREPPLRYIVRKNPHNDRWGDMKLYLKLQIEKRCLEVWGTEEALEEAIAKKTQQREASKHKKFKKKMLELRMNVRSSLYTRATKSHEHEYGDEEYHEEDDEYSKTCTTCGHSYRYDKM